MQNLNNKNNNQGNNIDISELPSIPNELKEILLNTDKDDNRLAIFFGNGISRLYGSPSWESLAEKLIDCCVKEEKINYLDSEILKKEQDLKKVITICEKLLDGQFYKKLTKIFQDTNKNNLESNFILDKLFSLSSRSHLKNNTLYLTTNIDNYKIYSKRPLVMGIDINKNKLNNNATYCLHGNIYTQNSITLTQEQYSNLYSQENYRQSLEKIFNHYNIIFIGYGLKEVEILDFLLKKSGVKKDNIKKRFLLAPFYSNQEKLYNMEQIYFDVFNINIIPYDISKTGYRQLENVLVSWNKDLELSIDRINDFNSIDNIILLLKNSPEESKQNMQSFVLNNHKNKQLFLDKLTNVDFEHDIIYSWLFLCKEQGFFKHLDKVKFVTDNSRSNEYWSTLDFLHKVAETNNKYPNDKVVEALLDIIKNNCKFIITEKKDQIFYGKELIFIRIIEKFSLNRISKLHIEYLIKLVGIWMIDGRLAQSTFVKIIQTKNKDLIFPLFEKILSYKETEEDNLEIHKPKKMIYNKNTSLMDSYWLTVLLKQNFNNLIKIDCVIVFDILLKMVKNAKNKNNKLFLIYNISVTFTENFISPVIEAGEESERKYDRLIKESETTELLSDTYLTSDLEYDGLITLLLKYSILNLKNEKDIFIIIEKLKSEKDFFFTRVACYLYTKFFSNYPDKIWPYLEENNFIINNNWATSIEKTQFLKKNSLMFTQEQLEYILRQIKQVEWKGYGPQEQITLQEKTEYLEQLPETFLNKKEYLNQCIGKLTKENYEYERNRTDIDIPVINIKNSFSEFNYIKLIAELLPSNKNKLRRYSDKENQILIEDLHLRPNFYLENFNNFLESTIKEQYLCTIINNLRTFVIENNLQTTKLLSNIKKYLDNINWQEAIKPAVYTSENLTTKIVSHSEYSYKFSVNNIAISLFEFLDKVFIDTNKDEYTSLVEEILYKSLSKCPTNITSEMETSPQDISGWTINSDLISKGDRSLLMNILTLTIKCIHNILSVNKTEITKLLEDLLISKSKEKGREREFSIFFGKYFYYIYHRNIQWSKEIANNLLAEDKESMNYLDFIFIFFNTESRADRSIYLDFKKHKIFTSVINSPQFIKQVNTSTSSKYENLADPKTLQRSVEYILAIYFEFEEKKDNDLITYLLEFGDLNAINKVIQKSYFDDTEEIVKNKIDKITYIWDKIIYRFENKNNKEEQYILFNLSPLYKYYALENSLDKDCFERLKYSFKAYSKHPHCEGSVFFLIDIMGQFYKEHPLNIANLWLESINNNGYFSRYREDLLQEIFKSLQSSKDTKAVEKSKAIQNKYLERGFYFLNN